MSTTLAANRLILATFAGYLTGLLPIILMESKGNEKGRVYCAHGTLRLFVTELVVSLSSSQHSTYTLGKKGIVRRYEEKRLNKGK